MNEELDGRILIRLKIAHGPKNDGDFLLQKSEVDSLKEVLADCPGNHRVNAKYLLSMIRNNYFHEGDICTGAPLEETMGHKDSNRNDNSYNSKAYVCHVLRHSCVIDTKGDMYPCCFLFDDNCGNSSGLRPEYKVKEPKGVALPESLADSGDLAARWYFGKELKDARKARVPVSEAACWYCTRHFYQNKLLNEVHKLFEQRQDLGLAGEFARRCEKDPTMQEPYWL